jgi:uncharacterized membrane protein
VPGLTLAGAMHATLAVAAITVGIIQFIRRKGDATHRVFGYAYGCAALIGDGTAMLIYRFTGSLNILHFGAMTSIVCIIAGLRPLLRTPRRRNWKHKHYLWISWSYVGLLAAASTELVVRTLPFRDHVEIWAATAATTLSVTAVGYLIIKRNRLIVMQ